MQGKDWTTYFFDVADTVASKSKDPSTKVGTVIVGKDKEIVSVGYNGFPRGVRDRKKERYDRPQKYRYTEHSERNAIYNAARIGVSTKGCDMYVNKSILCIGCARAIVQSGIETLNLLLGTNEPYGDNYEHQDKVETIFKESGLKVNRYSRD